MHLVDSIMRNLEAINIQGVSRLVDINGGGDFLGHVIKKVHINMCPIFDGYGVMEIF